TFYFAGDTGYNDVDFKSIGNTWKGIDLSLIPIGAYMPQVFMNPDHISPEEAVRIHNDVGSKLSVGMHFGTFRLSDEELMRPSYDLSMELSKKQIEPKFFRTLAHGYEINW
ncbi:MAG: phospholipase, partial [Chlamydiae bacterium]|nr:phospholipase [Chlamydiota bacterium]